jgi:hypothetical protein
MKTLKSIKREIRILKDKMDEIDVTKSNIEVQKYETLKRQVQKFQAIILGLIAAHVKTGWRKRKNELARINVED